MGPERPSKARVRIEVCIDSVESALAAVRGGVDRLELCANIGLGGGTTPSLGLLKVVQRAAPEIPVMVMVRPRTGDFLYTQAEFEVMLEDIRLFKQAGANGVVFGVLTKDGKVDTARTAKLALEAVPMQSEYLICSRRDDVEVCFHRAFDMTQDVMQALYDVCSIPHITRILTSGHAPTIDIPGLLPLFKALAERTSISHPSIPTIMPGSGINTSTVRGVLDALLPWGLRDVHLSAGSWVPCAVEFRREGMGMGIGGESEWGIWRTSEDRVREVRRIVDQAVDEAEGLCAKR